MIEDLGAEPTPTPEAALRRGGPPAILQAAERVASVLAAHADEHDRAGRYAPDNIAAVWRAGLGNLTLPRAAGGVGADLRTTARAIEVLAGGDPSTALILVMHLLQLHALGDPRSPWPDQLRKRLIADSLAGPALINALRVEPELGTPARGGIPATRAVQEPTASGPTWRLNGHKIYSTGGIGLRWLLVWAVTDDADPGGQRVGFFVVPASAPGVEIRPTWDHLGMRASASDDVLLHDVRILVDDVVNLQPVGTSQWLGSPAWATILILAIYQGVAAAGRDWLVRYLNERIPSNLGAPLASLPRFQTAVGEIEALLHTNRCLLDDLVDDAQPRNHEDQRQPNLLAKVVITANVIRSLEITVSLTGNPGLSHHHPLQRHYRDALCSRIHTPQDDVVLLNAGKAVLGI
jgi:alkylation response protein AidB-like acyl-CoA dehydrogenase